MSGVYGLPLGMQAQYELSHDAKVTAAPAQCPEQVSILGLIGSENASIANYNRSLFWVSSWAEMGLAVSTHLNEVIYRETMLGAKPTITSS